MKFQIYKHKFKIIIIIKIFNKNIYQKVFYYICSHLVPFFPLIYLNFFFNKKYITIFLILF